MKTLFILIIGVVLGYFLGAYSFFKFTVAFSADNVSKIIVDSAQDVYSGSSANISKALNGAVTKTSQEVAKQIEQKKEEIKNDLQQQLMEYMKSRINDMFSKI